MTITIESIHNHPSDDDVERKNIYLNIDGASAAYVINYKAKTTRYLSGFDARSTPMIHLVNCIIEFDEKNPEESLDRFMKLLVLK
jgi:hypothetical protein